MTLTPDQIKAREGRLTASRVAVLMRGDAPGIMRLYREMIGEEIEENLSHVWPVRLGEVTEKLQLDWMQERSGNAITRRGEVCVHPAYTWAAATLDGWDDVLECPIECKHVGGREPLEVIIERYQPQMQWQMEVTGALQCGLSVIMGANPPVLEFVERAEDYAIEMVARGKQFMECVRLRRPPVALDPVPPPADPTRIVDMTGNNQWATNAVSWMLSKPAADECKSSEKVLKAMVPEDAKKVFGHGVRITRDRAGRLSLREDAA